MAGVLVVCVGVGGGAAKGYFNKGVDWASKEMNYVYDVERFLLKLQHQIRTEDGRAFQSSHAAGFLLINGSLHSVRCSAAKIKSGACANNMVGFEGSTPCGSTDGTQHPACFSTGFADFFSLDIVLQAGWASIERQTGCLTNRGYNMSLEVVGFLVFSFKYPKGPKWLWVKTNGTTLG